MDKRSELHRAIEEVYGRPLKATDDVFSLGGSSLQALQLVVQFEAVLGVPVDVERLITAETISELVDELAADAPPIRTE
ncbi:acyl carrier protein [Streptomyces sp. NPDC052020]|uniref:acyl carrier protein n=1 Tax=Streptomyces sp. NPDC052020 TaxID=3155677 RepID=UPI00343A63F6